MAYVNGTTHYNLPQTVGTDKRDWADTNEAFNALDAAVYSAVEDVADAQTEINGLKDRMTAAEGDINTNANDISALDGRVTTLEGTVSQHTTQIADVRQDLEDMICAYNEASATSTHAYAVGDYFIYNDVLYRAIQAIAIGDTIVPDTNCTTTNVSTELLNIIRVPSVTVTGDGTKTLSQLLNELFAAINNIISDVTKIKISELYSGGTKLLATNITPARIDFSGSYYIGGDGSFACSMYSVMASDSLARYVKILNGTSTYSDNSSTIPAAGTQFTFSVYKVTE